MRKVALAIVIVVGTVGGIWSLLRPVGSLDAATEDRRPLLIVYTEPSFKGRSLEVWDSVVDFPVEKSADGATFDWNDSIRSIRVVRGTWRLHQHGRLNTELDGTPLEVLNLATRKLIQGWSCLLSATSAGVLELPTAESGGWGEDVSSIALISDKNLPDFAAP